MDFQKIEEYFRRNDRFAAYCGFRIDEVGDGLARVSVEVEERHRNGLDMVHGGALFALADFAFAVASNSDGLATVALGGAISFFAPGTVGRITASARRVHQSRKIAIYEIDLYDDRGTHLARMQGTGYRKTSHLPGLAPDEEPAPTAE